MARIVIKDLDEHQTMSKAVMKKVYGGTEYDRYQNIDTSYLLTRIEYYKGITPITSNDETEKKL